MKQQIVLTQLKRAQHGVMVLGPTLCLAYSEVGNSYTGLRAFADEFFLLMSLMCLLIVYRSLSKSIKTLKNESDH